MYSASGFLQDFLFIYINVLRKYVILKDHEKKRQQKSTERKIEKNSLQKQNYFQENEKHFTYIFVLSTV